MLYDLFQILQVVAFENIWKVSKNLRTILVFVIIREYFILKWVYI